MDYEQIIMDSLKGIRQDTQQHLQKLIDRAVGADQVTCRILDHSLVSIYQNQMAAAGRYRIEDLCKAVNEVHQTDRLQQLPPFERSKALFLLLFGKEAFDG